jgi:hypothetical protein
MTLSLIPPDTRLRRFIATAGQTVFPVTFPFFAASDLAVVRARAGVETTLALTADYTVTGAGNEAGGTVTLTAPALANDIIVIRSAQPIARTEDFADGQALTSVALNAEFARWWIALQQLAGALSRVIALAETDAAADVRLPPVDGRRNRLLGFDANGDLVALDLEDVLGDGGDYVILQTEDGVSLAVAQTLLDALLAQITGSIGAFSAYSTGTVLPLADRAAWQSELQIVPGATTNAAALAHVLAQGGTFAAKVTLDPALQTAPADAATRGFVAAEVAAVSLGTQPYIHAQHEEAAGTGGGTATAGAWNPCKLNTTKATGAAISGASHNTGTYRITLPAGTYRARGRQEFRQIEGDAQIRLRDITGAATLAVGSVNRTNGDRGQFQSTLDGTFTLAGASDVELQYRVGGTRATDGLGNGLSTTGWGEVNVFASLMVEKVA